MLLSRMCNQPLRRYLVRGQVASMDQSVRDAVGTTLLELTLRELFVWRFMQTDPNWGNFLFDAPSGRLHLIDFGAARGQSPPW